jgi:hypothetical protein
VGPLFFEETGRVSASAIITHFYDILSILVTTGIKIKSTFGRIALPYIRYALHTPATYSGPASSSSSSSSGLLYITT